MTYALMDRQEIETDGDRHKKEIYSTRYLGSEVLTVSANRELRYVKRPNNGRGRGLWTIPSSRSGAVVAQFRAKKGARIVG